jgi:copper chaperone NosL
MKIMYKKLLTLLIIPALFACTGSEPVPFNIGKDACDHCKMTIMSNKYGLELLNSKGKAFKFDDISCGVQYIKAHSVDVFKSYALDHKSGAFVETSLAFFLKSDKNRTPMNSNIVAFTSKADAEKLQKSKGGELITWESIQGLY